MADPDRLQAQQDEATVLMLVLDTSAMSAVMHGIEGAIDRLRNEAPEQVFLVAPVAAEIQFGLERLTPGSRRRRLLEAEYNRLVSGRARSRIDGREYDLDGAHEYRLLVVLVARRLGADSQLQTPSSLDR